MKVLIVFAHPERKSLNGSFLDAMVSQLKSQGDQVKVSDLYAINWKATVDVEDFPHVGSHDRLQVFAASHEATSSNSLTADVVAEQEKLLWCDVLIMAFPLWWFHMPAIMKGWVERVFSAGFGYGVGEYTDTRYGERYGEGVMCGKRAMLVITAGAHRDHFSSRGINGPMKDVLFTINHGMLFYSGFAVLPPFITYRADRMTEDLFEKQLESLVKRLQTLKSTDPIPFREQNGGDYFVPSLQLRPEAVSIEHTGYGIHLKK